jgi:hypothetical protein
VIKVNKWQQVDDMGMSRLEVPSGWLVMIHAIEQVKVSVPLKDGLVAISGATRETVMRPLNGLMSLCFVFDPEHKWAVEALPEAKNGA